MTLLAHGLQDVPTDLAFVVAGVAFLISRFRARLSRRLFDSLAWTSLVVGSLLAWDAFGPDLTSPDASTIGTVTIGVLTLASIAAAIVIGFNLVLISTLSDKYTPRLAGGLIESPDLWRFLAISTSAAVAALLIGYEAQIRGPEPLAELLGLAGLSIVSLGMYVRAVPSQLSATHLVGPMLKGDYDALKAWYESADTQAAFLTLSQLAEHTDYLECRGVANLLTASLKEHRARMAQVPADEAMPAIRRIAHTTQTVLKTGIDDESIREALGRLYGVLVWYELRAHADAYAVDVGDNRERQLLVPGTPPAECRELILGALSQQKQGVDVLRGLIPEMENTPTALKWCLAVALRWYAEGVAGRVPVAVEMRTAKDLGNAIRQKFPCKDFKCLPPGEIHKLAGESAAMDRAAFIGEMDGCYSQAIEVKEKGRITVR